MWWLLQEARTSRGVIYYNLYHNRLFWTVLAQIFTGKSKQILNILPQDMRLMAVQRVRNYSTAPKTREGPTPKCDNRHSLTQLQSAGCFHLTDGHFFQRSQSSGAWAESTALSTQGGLPPLHTTHTGGLGKAEYLPSPPHVLWLRNL